MAVKKEETVETVETVEKKVLTPEDPGYWEEKVPFQPFYDGIHYVDDISVCVNGERILIKRDIDEPVMIKRKFLHAIRNAEKQSAAAERFSKKMEYKGE